jgi:hypothetical protein
MDTSAASFDGSGASFSSGGREGTRVALGRVGAEGLDYRATAANGQVRTAHLDGAAASDIQVGANHRVTRASVGSATATGLRGSQSIVEGNQTVGNQSGSIERVQIDGAGVVLGPNGSMQAGVRNARVTNGAYTETRGDRTVREGSTASLSATNVDVNASGGRSTRHSAYCAGSG